VSFKAKDTAKPPTPKAVISGVIDIPNDCKTNKNPNEKIDALINPLKIPVDGRELLFLDQTSSKPIDTLEAVTVIDRTKKATIIFDRYSLYGSPRSASLKAIESDARKNQKTITELTALITTSSPFQVLLSDNFFSLLNKYLLNIIPRNVPPITTTRGIIFIFVYISSILYSFLLSEATLLIKLNFVKE